MKRKETDHEEHLRARAKFYTDFVRHNNTRNQLSRATKESAGLDLVCNNEFSIEVRPGFPAELTNSTKYKIPKGCVGLVVARSSLAWDHHCTLLNGIGVIDSDYEGPIKFLIANLGYRAALLPPYARIAQLIIVPYQPVAVRVRSKVKRGKKGFGSSG